MRRTRFFRYRPVLRKLNISKTLSAILFLVIFIGLFWIIVATIDAHIRPMISQLAKAKVDYLASKAINKAIEDRISDGSFEYDKIVFFEKDIYGNITALKTDMITINRLKSGIIDDVLDEIDSIDTSELSIPIGSLMKSDLFAGRGPRVPVRIIPVGTAGASFENVFTSAGINQTRHQILMEVTVDIGVLLPGYTASTVVNVQVNIAETVIVGTVPDTYTNLTDSGLFSDSKRQSAIVP